MLRTMSTMFDEFGARRRTGEIEIRKRTQQTNALRVPTIQKSLNFFAILIKFRYKVIGL